MAGIGAIWRPDPQDLWYAHLRKPPLRPPGAVIAPAWAVLDVSLAYAGTRLLVAADAPGRRVALAAWAITVSGLATYPWLMFGRRRVGPALLVVGGMLGTTLVTIQAAGRVDRKGARALRPLAAWLAFAFYLQEELWRRNRGLHRTAC